MDKRTTILLLVLAASFATLAVWNAEQSGSGQFNRWKMEHNVHYSTLQQNDYREKIFLSNVESIRLHNQNPKRTYNKGINKFTALTQEEFMATYLYEISKSTMKPKIATAASQDEGVMVDDVDWVEKGAVTQVKDQGQCTSGSWAFSATGSMEALNKIAYGELKKFSDQQLIDCTGTLCSCSGGFTDMSFRYIESHGLCEDSQYPYTGTKQACKPTQCTFRVSDYDYVDNCNGIGKVIQQRPLSVAVDATNWKDYSSGVFMQCTTKINSMALLTGVKEGNWVVKNSWGKGWGELGYIRLAPGNTCGICSIALYPFK